MNGNPEIGLAILLFAAWLAQWPSFIGMALITAFVGGMVARSRH